MTVKSVNDHPDADALKVYSFTSPEHQGLQIVANLENVYSVDDLVYVALEGSLLKDGTGIKPTRLRGVQSYGMAMGIVDKKRAKAGDDFSDRFCQESISGDTKMIKWVDIASCFNVFKYLKEQASFPKLQYALKIKIHGTNAAVQLTKDGGVFAQSRSRVITPSDDNCGFALWVNENIDMFKSITVDGQVMTIFGEWAGSTIQKNVAISEIDRKIFCVFAIQYGGRDGEIAELEVEPEKISAVLPDHPDIYVLPWFQRLDCNFGDRKELNQFVEELNDVVHGIERCDPWVKETFGIEGLGEGVVAYPLFKDGKRITREMYSDHVFKAKGERHKVVKVKQPVQLDPEVAESVEAFVDLFTTDARFEQGLAEAGGAEMKNMGKFLGWFCTDVKKESEAELEASGLNWKQVAKALTNAAKLWFMGRLYGAS